MSSAHTRGRLLKTLCLPRSDVGVVRPAHRGQLRARLVLAKLDRHFGHIAEGTPPGTPHEETFQAGALCALPGTQHPALLPPSLLLPLATRP